MTKRTKFIAAGAASALALGGGVAFAAKQLDSPTDESQAVIDDAAKQLGVTPTALSNALEQALEDRVDAAVAAGRLTKAEGDALKARIAAGALPFFGPGFHHGPFRAFGLLHDAAAYIGVTNAQLRSELESGKTLADVAKAHGKSVDGLVGALVNAATKRLDAAVAAGRLTHEREESILSGLRDRITAFVNGTPGRVFGLHPAEPLGPDGGWR